MGRKRNNDKTPEKREMDTKRQHDKEKMEIITVPDRDNPKLPAQTVIDWENAKSRRLSVLGDMKDLIDETIIKIDKYKDDPKAVHLLSVELRFLYESYADTIDKALKAGFITQQDSEVKDWVLNIRVAKDTK